jgi:hypothetical protein
MRYPQPTFLTGREKTIFYGNVIYYRLQFSGGFKARNVTRKKFLSLDKINCLCQNMASPDGLNEDSRNQKVNEKHMYSGEHEISQTLDISLT